MEEAFMQSGFRLAFPAKNIHTAAMILLLLIGMLAAEDLATKADVMRADQVIVLKSQRTLTLLSQGKVLRTYRVARKFAGWRQRAAGRPQDSGGSLRTRSPQR